MTEPAQQKRSTDINPLVAIAITVIALGSTLLLAKCHNEATRAAQADRPIEQGTRDKPEPDPLLDAYILWQSF